jgi:hypothetical protein
MTTKPKGDEERSIYSPSFTDSSKSDNEDSCLELHLSQSPIQNYLSTNKKVKPIDIEEEEACLSIEDE